MSITTEDKGSVSKTAANTNRGGRLIEYAQLHGIAGHWTPASRSGIAVVPISPRGGIVRQALTGDVAQCLINPFARFWIERRVFRKLQQPWHGRAPLLLAQHPGLSQPARRALADHRRRVVMKNIEQRRDGLISSQIRQPLDCPVADVD